MKESSLSQEGTLSTRTSGQDEVWLAPERFKVRMVRLLRALDDFWTDFRRMQQYGRGRCRENE